MRAIILAAGQGTRLRPYTDERPKCLVELGGRALLDHQVDTLRAAGIDDICVATGYRSELIDAKGLPTIKNPRYETTNMVSSLMCAADILDGSQDVLAVYGDIVFEPRIIEAMRASSAPFATSIDLRWRRLWELRLEDPLSDAETLRLDADGNIEEIGGDPTSIDEIQGQYMGLIKFGAEAAPRIVAHYEGMKTDAAWTESAIDNLSMTAFLQVLIDGGFALKAVTVEGGWLEVDSVDDLDRYRRMLADGSLADFWKAT